MSNEFRRQDDYASGDWRESQSQSQVVTLMQIASIGNISHEMSNEL